MFCCLLAFLIVGPLGLAVTAPRARTESRDCCAPRKFYPRLWEICALLAMIGGAGLLLLAVTRPAESRTFFHAICSIWPAGRTD